MKIDKIKLDCAMAEKTYTVKKLSKESHVSQVTIARITKGYQKARPNTIGKIAKALDVSIDNIICKEDAWTT